jgi:hypothetical protein
MDKYQYSLTPDERAASLIGLYQFLMNPRAKEILMDERTKESFTERANYFLNNRINDCSHHLNKLLAKTLASFLDYCA